MRLDELSNRRFDSGHHSKSLTLYYGTCRGKALSLEQSGFDPRSLSGVKFMTLVSTPGLAKKQAAENECDAILKVVNVSVDSIMPLNFAPMDNPNSRQDMIDDIEAGAGVTVRLVKPHKSFVYVNKIRKRPRK